MIKEFNRVLKNESGVFVEKLIVNVGLESFENKWYKKEEETPFLVQNKKYNKGLIGTKSIREWIEKLLSNGFIEVSK